MMHPFDRLLSIMIKPWVLVSCVGFIVLSFLYLDQSIAYYFHGLNLRQNCSVLNWITNLGLGGFYVISLFGLALFFRYVKRYAQWESRAWFLWSCVVFPSLICLLLKMVFGRARPELLFHGKLYGFYGFQTHASFWSFPSGHTTTSMGLVFGLSILFPRYGYAFILSGLIIAASRVLLVHHYLSDVLTASYLALLEVGLLLYWLRRNRDFAPVKCRT